MKTSSCKAKGRRLAQKVKEAFDSMMAGISRQFKIKYDGNITVTPSGVNGEDIVFHGDYKKLLPFSIECKNQERLNFNKAWVQTTRNTSQNKIPILISSRNRSEILATLPFKDLINFINSRVGVFMLEACLVYSKSQVKKSREAEKKSKIKVVTR